MRNTPSRTAILALILLVLPAIAHAQGVGVLDSVVGTFMSRAAAFGASFTTVAKDIFGGLAGIELTIIIGFAVAAKADLTDILVLVTRQLVIIGLFWYFLVNWSTISRAIMSSFGVAANNATIAAGGSANLSPSDLVSSGLNMAHACWSGLAWDHPALSILLVLAGLIIIYVYAKITGLVIEVLIESLIISYAGIILMGFGGSSFTREYAQAQFRFAISVGAKRLVLQLLIGISETLVQGWSASISGGGVNLGWDSIALMVAVPIVLLQLCEKLPYRAQDMVNGTSTHGGGSLLGKAASVAGYVGGAAVAVAGGVAATSAAFKAAQASLASAGGGGGLASGGGGSGGLGGGGGGEGGGGSGGGGESSASGGFSRGVQLAARTAGNLGRSATQDVGRRMGGSRYGHGGSMGFRMANQITDRLKEQGKEG